METVWFILVAGVTAAYAVTDGFDLGIGVLFPLIARNEVQRASVRATIGHTWRLYEDWLIVLGALLFLAFPRLYAVSFSGFYLAFMILLWCLIGRGLALEIRSHLGQPVWRTACDILFPLSSLLIALALGAAVGNVIRGVPLEARGLVFLPLWTDLSLAGGPAIFDWYTLTTGVLAVAAFTLHGAGYLALKTEGELRQRARRLALWSALPTAALTVASFAFAPGINPALMSNYRAHPGLYLIVALTIGALAATVLLQALGRDLMAFGASSLLIVGYVASIAAALYPNLLPARPDPTYSLTIYNSSAANYGLTVALLWFGAGLGLIVFYMIVTHALFAGRVRSGGDEFGPLPPERPADERTADKPDPLGL